jgi:hypothetical protein
LPFLIGLARQFFFGPKFRHFGTIRISGGAVTTATVCMAGIRSEELRWIRLLVDLLRHQDPTVPELACQALLYLSQGAKTVEGLYQNNQEKG